MRDECHNDVLYFIQFFLTFHIKRKFVQICFDPYFNIKRFDDSVISLYC